VCQRHVRFALICRNRTIAQTARLAYGEPSDGLTWAQKLKALEVLARVDGLLEKEDCRRPITSQ
jgi:hypothetical protein